MISDELIHRYPLVYHMAEPGSWDSIQKHGLLSTTALLDLFEITGQERYKIESQWRKECLTITHPVHGKAVIRDQKPMPDKDLTNYLVGLTPQEWYKFINRKTFFWVDTTRLIWMLSAPPYRDRAHWVITVPTRPLVECHGERITLSGQNSGSILDGRKRGKYTFRPIEEFSMRWVAELAVDYSVPDVADLAVLVEEWKRNRKLSVIWKRG